MAIRLSISANTAATFERDAAQASISLDDMLRKWKAQGMTAADATKALTDAFNSGQGPFAQFQKLTKQSVAGLTSRSVSIETARNMSGGDGSVMGVWMSTGGSNVCPGCEKAHGEKMTADEFEHKHGTNECGANCYCFWMPGETAEAGAFKIREVMNDHPEWFRNLEGVQPPSMLQDRTITSRQEKNSKADVEVATVVDATGSVVAEVRGDDQQVSAPLPRNPGRDVLTHNHVIGSPPSGDDLSVMMQLPYAEVRNSGWDADGSGNRTDVQYRLARGTVDQHPLMKEADRAAKEAGMDPGLVKGDRLSKAFNRMYTEELAKVSSNKTLQQRKDAKHAALLRLSREYGVLYVKEISRYR